MLGEHPTARQIISKIERDRRLRHWKWTTTRTVCGTIIGALRRGADCDALRHPIWKDYLRSVNIAAIQEPVCYPQPVSREVIQKAIIDARLRQDYEVALFLAIQWATAARPNCVAKLKAANVNVTGNKASFLFQEGKDTVTENVFASPQKFVFRPLERLFEVVATAEYAMVYDFKAYFYQFKLEDAVQPYFSFRKDQRFYCFTRLPMGFSKAVAVAQITTETLAKMACEDLFSVFDVYIDNVLFLGALAVSRSRALAVSRSRALAVSRSRALAVSRSRALAVSRSRALAVSRSRALAVSRSRALAVSRSRALAVSRSRALAVSRSRALAVSRSRALAVSRSRALVVSRSRALAVSRSRALAVSRSRALAVPRSRALAASRSRALAVSRSRALARRRQAAPREATGTPSCSCAQK